MPVAYWCNSQPMFAGFLPPSERLLLRSDALELEVWPQLGAAVAALAFRSPDGRRIPLFREAGNRERYTPVDHLSSWPLLPYSNRIRAGRFAYQGRQHILPANYPGVRHPLHGVGWLRAWRHLESGVQHCALGLNHHSNAHWPYNFSAQQHYWLEGSTLHSRLSLTNTSELAMPCGLGQHPYVNCPTGTRIRAQVRGVWLSDDEALPRAYELLPQQWNLAAGILLDNLYVDNCFDGLNGAIEVRWPDGSTLIVEGSPNLQFLVVYHPQGGDYVCLEPVSHMPDAFNHQCAARDSGMLVLQPGATLQVTHRYSYQPAPPRGINCL